MDEPIIRLPIQYKLADGRLPHDHIPRIWDGPGSGETCDGCGETVTNAQMVMGGLDARGRRVQFHVACFRVWEVERQVQAPTPSARLPARSAFRASGARQWSSSAPSARPASSA